MLHLKVLPYMINNKLSLLLLITCSYLIEITFVVLNYAMNILIRKYCKSH